MASDLLALSVASSPASAPSSPPFTDLSPPDSPASNEGWLKGEVQRLQAALDAEKAAHDAEKAALVAEKQKNKALQERLKQRSGNEPQLIANGCFGYIYAFPLQLHVYKTTQAATEGAAATLRKEFNMLCAVYQSMGDSRSNAEFVSPRPWAFFDPFNDEIVTVAADSPPRADKGPGYRESRSRVRDASWGHFEAATFAFDLIPSLHQDIQDAYRRLFFAESLGSPAYNVRVLRLYLGRTLPQTVELLPDGNIRQDLKLDRHRYSRLAEELQNQTRLPELRSVARSMGSALSTLHYGAGIDGRDIELILAGDRYLGTRPYVTDFNQCQQWLKPQYLQANVHDPNPTTGHYAQDDLLGAARRMAKMIFFQEYYYPRPSVCPELFDEFAAGYLLRTGLLLSKYGCGLDIINQMTSAAEAFLAEFATRDSQRKGWNRPRVSLADLEARQAKTEAAAIAE